uniref:Uncharacterized protein n=1 Tax=Romanomermis culicivorax TaxID=13658 RepID=A0A915JHA2_ROMCU
MNNTNRNLLYLDIAVDNDDLDRLIIEPCRFTASYNSSNEFERRFFVRKIDDVMPLTLFEVRFKNYVKFGIDSSLKKPIEDTDATSSAHAFNNRSGNGTVLDKRFYEELPMGVMVVNQTRDEFYILTCRWSELKQFSDFDVFGRVFKGMGSVIHLSALKSNSKGRPATNIRIKDFGIIPPGSSLLGLKRRDALLDQFPFLPQDASSIDFNDADRVSNAAYAIKSSGNILFHQGKFEMASFRFDKAVRYLSHAMELKKSPFEHEDRLISLAVACMLDSATCKIKRKDFDAALNLCNEAFEYNPDNSKIYFRRGQAFHGLLSYEKSLADLNTAQRLAPNDKDALFLENASLFMYFAVANE